MQLPEHRHHRLRGFYVCWLMLFALLPASLSAKSPGVHTPVLEQAISSASLVVVARVDAVGETRVVSGGKTERVIQTIDFEPVQTLKGVFMRDVLALTSEDLGRSAWTPAFDSGWTPVLDSTWTPEIGELRLLLLGRSGTGYENVYRQPTLDQSLPVLHSGTDPLVATVELLIAVTQEHDRARKVELLLKGIETTGGSGAVPLLDSLRYRALLAAQHTDITSVTRLLSDPAPEVKAATARTLGAILEADYLENGEVAEKAVAALVELLEASDPFVATRVAALDAIGTAQSEAVPDIAAEQLRLGLDRTTWAEEAAVIRAIGRQQLRAFADPILTLAEGLELDAVNTFAQAALSALIHLDPMRAASVIERRMDDKRLAGLEVELEIQLAGELPVDQAVSVLTSVPVERLNRGERAAFAAACQQVKDDRLIPPLTRLLDARLPEVHWQVVEALRKIDTLEAAEALRPYLAQEADLHRKLEIAEFLGRHGIVAGLPYAMEHLSQPHLLELSIAVLVAVSTAESVDALRGIVNRSNDIAWTGAAMQALGALQDRELAPELLGIVEDLRHPLTPYALVALGELGEPRAIEVFREGVRSRDDRIVVASVQGAASLVKRGEIDDESLRDEIAGLLASADGSREVRTAALDALRELEDPRLDVALAAAALDGQLEGTPFLETIEELLEERKVRVAAPG